MIGVLLIAVVAVTDSKDITWAVLIVLFFAAVRVGVAIGRRIVGRRPPHPQADGDDG